MLQKHIEQLAYLSGTKENPMHPPPSNKTMESLNTLGLYSLYLRTK